MFLRELEVTTDVFSNHKLRFLGLGIVDTDILMLQFFVVGVSLCTVAWLAIPLLVAPIPSVTAIAIAGDCQMSETIATVVSSAGDLRRGRLTPS